VPSAFVPAQLPRLMKPDWHK